MRPFVLESQSQFRTDGPQALNSGAYAQDYNEVKRLGRLNSEYRTERQTAIALFHTASPIELWNRTLREITAGDGTVEQARLFAMATMAGADSIINTWDDKAFWNFWRPITGDPRRRRGRQRRHRGRPGLDVADPVAAVSRSPVGLHRGDHRNAPRCRRGARNQAPGLHGPAPRNHDQLHYRHLDEAVRDVVDARVWLGIHFRTADVHSMVLGRKVTHWLSKHYFREAT